MDQGRDNAKKMVGWLAEQQDERQAAGERASDLGPVSENPRMVVNGIPRAMHAELQRIAFKAGLSLSQLGAIGLEMVIQHARAGTLPVFPEWSGPEA